MTLDIIKENYGDYMNDTSVKIYYNYYQKDANDLVGFEEKGITYKRAKQLFDSYPWSDELLALEERGESGGMNYYKGDYNNIYTSLNIYVVEDEKVSISFDVCAKKGFLGLFGNKKVSKDLSELTYSQAKAVIKDIFTYSEDELYELYR